MSRFSAGEDPRFSKTVPSSLDSNTLSSDCRCSETPTASARGEVDARPSEFEPTLTAPKAGKKLIEKRQIQDGEDENRIRALNSSQKSESKIENKSESESESESENNQVDGDVQTASTTSAKVLATKDLAAPPSSAIVSSSSSPSATNEQVVEEPASTMPLSSTYWPQTFWHSLMTKWSLQREAYDQSYQHSLKALETDPLSPELQINLGNSLEGLGSISKARDAYATSEKLTPDPVIHFQSRFNQAQAFAKEKKIDEALNLYQKALEIDPSSKIVKTNIELLLSASGGKGSKGDKDQENQDDQNEGEGQDQDKSKQPKEPKKFAQNPKPSQGKKQPQDLSQGDIKKILEEIKQQEQKIRGDYYKQSNNEQKQKGSEGKREKDW